jgi:fructose/tagatose bisphosphate aldolase
MTYTSQRPAEYVTSILGAAIAEGYRGPVFIQGDHFQVSAKRFAADRQAEVNALKALMKEAIDAGFYNIDVDTSTLVDLSQDGVPAQQALNSQMTAMFVFHIRGLEPADTTISIGGEIGEVGGHNSTVEELRAFLDGFNDEITTTSGSITGLSKISIQTGTSHGGVVLPDGSIAQVEVDFNTLKKLSQLAKSEYGMGGAVQHGASTLPESAFSKFVDAEACEVHLATNFMNMFFENIPADLKEKMYAYLRDKSSAERKPDMTDEQFYYKTRKNVIGPFKTQTWHLDEDIKEKIQDAWEAQFTKLFKQLGLDNTRRFVDQTIKPVPQSPDLRIYLGEAIEAENVSDLAD